MNIVKLPSNEGILMNIVKLPSNEIYNHVSERLLPYAQTLALIPAYTDFYVLALNDISIGYIVYDNFNKSLALIEISDTMQRMQLGSFLIYETLKANIDITYQIKASNISTGFWDKISKPIDIKNRIYEINLDIMESAMNATYK